MCEEKHFESISIETIMTHLLFAIIISFNDGKNIDIVSELVSQAPK